MSKASSHFCVAKALTTELWSRRGVKGTGKSKTGPARTRPRQGQSVPDVGGHPHTPLHSVQQKNATCHKCSKRGGGGGYFQAECRSVGINQIQQDIPGEVFLGAVSDSDTAMSCNPWTVTLRVDGISRLTLAWGSRYYHPRFTSD